MNLDHNFVKVSKLSEDQKRKRSSPKLERFFSPDLSGHLRSDAHQSQIIGWDADVDHTETIGGEIQPNYWGDISPPLPRVSAPLIIVLIQGKSNSIQYCIRLQHSL